jgi:hypothetical protein
MAIAATTVAMAIVVATAMADTVAQVAIPYTEAIREAGIQHAAVFIRTAEQDTAVSPTAATTAVEVIRLAVEP